MLPFRSLYLDQPVIPERILDIFEPVHSTQQHALFIIHGGGWRGGARANMHTLLLGFREKGFEAATTDYRLSSVTALDQIQDVRDALQVYHKDLIQRGHSGSIVLYGSSAGAHLALLTALLDNPPSPVTIAGIAVQAAPFTFEPWADIFPAIWTDMQKIVGKPYDTHPEIYQKLSPIKHVREGIPPIFALHAENEHMFPLEQLLEFGEAVKKVKGIFKHKVYPRTEHGFLYNFDRWQQRKAFEDILEFMNTLA